MISRVYIAPKEKDSREAIYKESFNKLDISGRVSRVAIVDSYTINANISVDALTRVAHTLTNPTIETSTINTLPPIGDFSFICEIGYLPGVTDNVGHTAKEEIADVLRRKFSEGEAVYTSRLFFI